MLGMQLLRAGPAKRSWPALLHTGAMLTDGTVVETNVHYPTDTNRASVLASGTFSSPMRVNAP